MVGVDEVGRGSWAGPLLVVAARAEYTLPPGIKDSKLLNSNQRNKILNKLSNLCKFGEGWVTPFEIDENGMAEAMRLGVARSLQSLAADYDEEITMDGKINYCPVNYINVSCFAAADKNVPIVSAASIYAKVTRDRYMHKLDLKYPLYGFKQHVGYGTTIHRQALVQHGYIPGIHRFSFRPVNLLSPS